jgi:hypothetical protein
VLKTRRAVATRSRWPTQRRSRIAVHDDDGLVPTTKNCCRPACRTAPRSWSTNPLCSNRVRSDRPQRRSCARTCTSSGLVISTSAREAEPTGERRVVRPPAARRHGSSVHTSQQLQLPSWDVITQTGTRDGFLPTPTLPRRATSRDGSSRPRRRDGNARRASGA